MRTKLHTRRHIVVALLGGGRIHGADITERLIVSVQKSVI